MSSLYQKDIIITGSFFQATDLENKITEKGGHPILLPLIKIKSINQEALQKAFDTTYDWIIFTSVNSIHCFFETIPVNSLGTIKIASIGAASTRALNKLGLQPDFIPTVATSKKLAAEIPLLETDRVFIPQSKASDNTLEEWLTKKVKALNVLLIYDTQLITIPSVKLKEIIEKPPSAIVFASGSAVISFAQNNQELHNKNMKVIVIGPSTNKVAEEQNIRVDRIANPHNNTGIIRALEDAFYS